MPTDERERLLEQLPALHGLLEIDSEELDNSPIEIPERQRQIIDLVDGKRTIQNIVDVQPGDEVSTLRAIAQLYFHGLLRQKAQAVVKNTISGSALSPSNPVGEVIGVMTKIEKTPSKSGEVIEHWRAATLEPQHPCADAFFEDLKTDPEISDAIETLGSNPPAVPFVRISPPAAAVGFEITTDQPLDACPPLEDDSELDVSYADKSRLPSGWFAMGTAALAGSLAVVMLLLTDGRAESAPLDTPQSMVGVASDRQATKIETTQETIVPAPVPRPPVVEVSKLAAPTQGGDYESLLSLAQGAKNRRQAEAAYRKALEINPNGNKALSHLAFALLNKGKNAEAAEYAQRAVVLDPTDSRAWVTLGAARQQLRDRPGAKEAYRNCVAYGQGRFVADCRAMIR